MMARWFVAKRDTGWFYGVRQFRPQTGNFMTHAWPAADHRTAIALAHHFATTGGQP